MVVWAEIHQTNSNNAESNSKMEHDMETGFHLV